MPLIDDLVRRAEQELKELDNDIDAIDTAINDLLARKTKKQEEEKAARKLYKSLRNQQPDRPRMITPSETRPVETTQYKPIVNPTKNGPMASTNGAKSQQQQIQDYEAALELLKAEDREFTVTEFFELAGAANRGSTQQKLKRFVEEGLVTKTQKGVRNTYDSAKYKVN